MRNRLLTILLTLMPLILLALGLPLAASQATSEQQHLVVDRIDDTSRFAGIAQNAGGALTSPPSQNHDDAPRGTDNERVQRTVLKHELARYQRVYGIRVAVYGRNGHPLVGAFAPRHIPDGPARQAFREALGGRRSHDPPQVLPWDDDRLYVASPIIRDGDVVAVTLVDSPTGKLRSRILRRWLIIAGGEAVALLVATALAFRLAGWVLRPVRVLDRASHDIATGRMASRVAPTGGPPELRRLVGAFNEMADTVEESVEQQRAFVADASHQLRNPLSALLLRIESLGLELPAGHEAELNGVRGEGRRLSRVLDDLLGLAQAERARPELELVDVGELLEERMDSWRMLADQHQVRLETLGPRAATAYSDPVSLGSALDTVLDNALKFTPADSRVVARIRVLRESVRITVTDAGPGLTEEELHRIGDRFWRSSLQQNTEGSGLGLSIARALLHGAGGKITFTNDRKEGSGGLTVSFSLPRQHPRHQ